VWIGIYEGGAIGMSLAGQKFPRPLTHDLMLTMLECVGVKVEKITITELRDSTFFAEISLERNGQKFSIDARPSDSIALAVRSNCPIFVTEAVFQACPELLKPITDEELTDFKEKLKTMTPEDFLKDLKNKETDGGDEGEEGKEGKNRPHEKS
jgi:hypothetical protein